MEDPAGDRPRAGPQTPKAGRPARPHSGPLTVVAGDD